MKLLDSIREECIRLGSPARSKDEVLKELAGLAKKSRLLEPFTEEELYQALEARERIGSTGFGRGIAIPHCSLEGLAEFVVGLLAIPEGADFDSHDGEKCRVFFLIVGPKERRNEHIQILSSLSKLLKKPKAIDGLVASADSRELSERLNELFSPGEEFAREKGRCLFQVFIQKEEYFEDILQVFSSLQASITVLEASNVGRYLHRLPLFSAYWTEQNRTFLRLILAVVDKSLSNEVIRQINMLAEGIGRGDGVLIAIQDLIYSSGTLEF